MKSSEVRRKSDRPVAVLNTTYGRSLLLNRSELMRAWIDNGYDVYAVAPDLTDEEKGSIAALGVTTVHIPMRRNKLDVVGDLAYSMAFYRLCKQLKPTFVLSYFQKAVVFGTLSAKLAGVPRIAALMAGLGYAFNEGSGFKKRFFGIMTKMLNRMSLSFCNPVIFQNPDDVRTLIELNLVRKDRCVVVDGSGVNLENYPQSQPPLSPVRFLMLSRLLASKGIGEYIAAARLVRAMHPDVVFELAGRFEPGSPDEIDPAILNEAVADKTILYLETLKDVRPALARCTAFVLPSYYREGIPRASLEALAVGRAIITADTPGCREVVIEGRNGFLVPPRDAQGLANAMLKLIAEPSLALTMGARSHELAQQRFTVKRVVQQMLDALDTANQPSLFRPLKHEKTAL